MNRADRTRRLGISAEQSIKRYMLSQGFDVLNSTEEENIKDDIDFKLRNLKGDVITVSVKAQSSAAVFGNLGFELQTTKGRPVGELKPSWWYTGKASHYLFVCDPKSYLDRVQIPNWCSLDIERYIPWYALIEKSKIAAYVEQWGWKKKQWLSQRVRGEESGHNALSGFLGVRSVVSPDDKVLLQSGWNVLD